MQDFRTSLPHGVWTEIITTSNRTPRPEGSHERVEIYGWNLLEYIAETKEYVSRYPCYEFLEDMRVYKQERVDHREIYELPYLMLHGNYVILYLPIGPEATSFHSSCRVHSSGGMVEVHCHASRNGLKYAIYPHVSSSREEDFSLTLSQNGSSEHDYFLNWKAKERIYSLQLVMADFDTVICTFSTEASELVNEWLLKLCIEAS